MKHRELTEKIIGCIYKVYNRMSCGFFINFDERKVEITCSAPAVLAPVAAGALAPRERKVRDFDEDLQDEF